MDKQVRIIVSAIDNATSGLKAAGSSIDSFAKRSQASFKSIMVAGTAAFAAISAVAVKGLSDYAAVERSQRQLEHAILDVAKGTQQQVEKVNDLADAIEKKTGMDADSIKAGVAQLSTFGLQSSSVVALTKSLADLTVNQNGVNATSDDYISSANTMAKALDGQFGALQKMGIRFTETQKNMIEHGTETQRIAAIQEGFAQNLRETTDTVGGVDVATAKLRTQMGNLSEGIGKAVAPALGQLADKLLPVIEKFVVWAEKNPELLAKIMAVVAGISLLAIAIGGIGLVIGPMIAGITAIGAALAFIGGPILILVALIGVLAYTIYKNRAAIKSYTSNLGASLKGTFRDIGGAITSVFNMLIAQAFARGNNLINMFKKGFESKVADMKASVVSVASTISDYLGFHSPAKKGPASDSDKWIPNLLKMMVKGFYDGKDSVGNAAKSIAGKIGESIEKTKEFLENLQMNAKSAFANIGSAISEHGEKVKSLVSEYKALSEKLKDVNKSIAAIDSQRTTDISSRAVAIQKEISDLTKQQMLAASDSDIVMKTGTDAEKQKQAQADDELKRKIDILNAELDIASANVTQVDIAKQKNLESLSETERIINTAAQKKADAEKEKATIEDQLKTKKIAINVEEMAYRNMVAQKQAMDTAYFAVFKTKIDEQRDSILETTRALQSIAGTGGATQAGSAQFQGDSSAGISSIVKTTKGAPKQIQPNANFNINLGGVTVNNAQDESRIVGLIKNALVNEARKFNLGVVM